MDTTGLDVGVELRLEMSDGKHDCAVVFDHESPIDEQSLAAAVDTMSRTIKKASETA